jgi:hypothetical protein
MIALTAALALIASPELPQWDQIQEWKHRDSRAARRAYDEWTVVTNQDGKEAGAKVRRWLDGRRLRQEFEAEGRLKLSSYSDGTTTWVILPGSGIYYRDPKPDPSFDQTWEERQGKHLDPSSFHLGVSGYDVDVAIHPKPTVTKIEEGKDERTVYATAQGRDSTMTIVMHFEKEKWIPTAVDASLSPRHRYVFKRTKIQRDQVFTTDLFTPQAKVTEGLRELSDEEKSTLIRSNGGR